jgi:hypothetical protein
MEFKGILPKTLTASRTKNKYLKRNLPTKELVESLIRRWTAIINEE